MRSILRSFKFRTLFVLIALTALVAGGAGSAIAADQIITLSPSTATAAQGGAFSLDVLYNTSDGNALLTGVSVTVHYDSSKLTYTGFTNFNSASTTNTLQPAASTDEVAVAIFNDGDADTDKMIQMLWSNTTVGSGWPNQVMPTTLVTLNFSVNNDAVAGTTNVNSNIYQNAAGYTEDVSPAVVTIVEAPKVTDVTSSVADGSYKAGDVIPVQVTFDQAVDVTGTPQLTLDTGVVNYTSGTGTTTLTFNYTVAAGDATSDLAYTGTDALALNGGTIVGANAAAIDAALTLPAVGGAGSLSGNKDIVIDTAAPSVAITAPAADVYQNTNTYQFKGTADSDTGSAIEYVKVSLNGGPYADATVPARKASVNWTYDATLTEGANTLDVYAIDEAGNESAVVSSQYTVYYDITDPTGQITLAPVNDVNGTLWAKAGPITATLTFDDNLAVDPSSPINVELGWTGGSSMCDATFTGDWTAPGTAWLGAATIGASCTDTYNVKVTGFMDMAGNVITLTQPLSVDAVDPLLTIGTTVTNCVGTSFTLTGDAMDSHSGIASVEVSLDGGSTWNAATFNDPNWTYGATLAAGANTLDVRATDNAGNVTTDSHDVFSADQLALSVNGQDVTGGTIYVPNVDGSNNVDVTVTGGTEAWGTYTWNLNPATPTVVSQTIGAVTTLSATVGLTGTQTLLVQDPVDGGMVFSTTVTVQTVEFTITGPEDAVIGDSLTYAALGATGTVTWNVTQGADLVSASTGTGDTFTVTALAKGTVKVTGTDSTTSVTSQPVTTEIYDPVSVTNKPADTPTVEAGTSTALYTVTGGDGTTYTWTVTYPDGTTTFVRTGTSFAFTPPKTGAFAGTYTIVVMDGSGYTDTFSIFTPIKLVAAEPDYGKIGPSVDNLQAVPPVAYEGDSIYLWAQGLAEDENLSVTYIQNPVTANDLVLEEVVTSTLSFFQVDALNEGVCLVAVSAQDGTFTDSLRVDVIGFGSLSGAITNNQPLVDLADVEVDLFDYATGQWIDDDNNVITGTYRIDNVPNGVYIVSLEGDGANYVPFDVRQRVQIDGDTVLDLVIPEVTPITGTYSLDVTFNGDYTGNGIDYTLTNADTGAVVRQGTHPEPSKGAIDDDLLLTGLSAGLYTFGVSGGGYVPQVWTDLSGSDVISLTADAAITMTLVNDAPAVEVYHQATQGGVKVFVVLAGAGWSLGEFEAELNNTDITDEMDGSGSAFRPFTYEWTPSDPNVDITPAMQPNGDAVYTLNFDFARDTKAEYVPYTYTVTYTVYANDDNREDDLDEDQTELETLNGGKALYVTEGTADFLPGVGATFLVNLPDADGVLHEVPITIPALPLNLLYVDDFDIAGYGNDNLLYDKSKANGGTDYYTEDKANAATLTPNTMLRAVAKFYTFGGDAYGAGASIKLVLASDGTTPVRYNPILLDGTKRARVEGAPDIILPVLLNKDSKVYASLKKMSDAESKLGIKVSERGDGTAGFHYESLDFSVSDKGVLYLELPHLTVIAPAAMQAAGDDNPVADDDESDCFVDTVSTGSGFAGLMLAMAALLAALAVRTRKNAA